MLTPLLAKYQLDRHGATIRDSMSAAVAFSLEPSAPNEPYRTASWLGGSAMLPVGFEWPVAKGRSLDFLLQIDCSVASEHDANGLLPRNGLLSFFYDLDRQPWGYDPADLEGHRVTYSTSSELVARESPNADVRLAKRLIRFASGHTLPHYGSKAFERLDALCSFTESECDRYFEALHELESLAYPAGSGRHRLLGHSANVQGDMQLEAALVTGGLYCGDATGYHDPRAKELERTADDWVLLLQLDSDDGGEIMWGDMGTLYYWIRKNDLVERRFDRVWMTLQCS